jgi:hypothetical protein
MNMIGHDDPGEQLKAHALVKPQGPGDQFGDSRLLEPTDTVSLV